MKNQEEDWEKEDEETPERDYIYIKNILCPVCHIAKRKEIHDTTELSMMDRWREFEHDRESPEEKPPSWMMLSPEDPRICRDCRMRVERKRHEKQLIIKLRNQNVLLKEKLRLLIDEKSKTMREYFGAKNQVKQTKTKIETKEPKDIESEENEVVEEEERDY